ILFISKKNNILYFYINCWRLNIIIIKNYYFLLLINKIMDHLNKIRIFPRFNLYDIYYYS
ncbi:hypothetical protein BO79DRAFT_149926, partial [Aspergillus costaricaensis CBS 115574]